MHRKHWIIAPLTAVMVLLGLTFGVGPAAAAATSGSGSGYGYGYGYGYGQACRFDYYTYNACLNVYPAPTGYRTSVIVGIDLKMPTGQAQQALLLGSSLRAMLRTTATRPGPGIVLPVRSGWPQAGPDVLSAQFGFDDLMLERVPGNNSFQAEIVFTEVHADHTITTRTYRTGIIYYTDPGDEPPSHCPGVCP